MRRGLAGHCVGGGLTRLCRSYWNSTQFPRFADGAWKLFSQVISLRAASDAGRFWRRIGRPKSHGTGARRGRNEEIEVGSEGGDSTPRSAGEYTRRERRM